MGRSLFTHFWLKIVDCLLKAIFSTISKIDRLSGVKFPSKNLMVLSNWLILKSRPAEPHICVIAFNSFILLNEKNINSVYVGKIIKKLIAYSSDVKFKPLKNCTFTGSKTSLNFSQFWMFIIFGVGQMVTEGNGIHRIDVALSSKVTTTGFRFHLVQMLSIAMVHKITDRVNDTNRQALGNIGTTSSLSIRNLQRRTNSIYLWNQWRLDSPTSRTSWSLNIFLTRNWFWPLLFGILLDLIGAVFFL